MNMSEALGIIQTDGIPALFAAIDAALKAADVTVDNYERVNGGSMVVIRIYGDMASVQAAVEAGVTIAKQISPRVISTVIGRPQLTI